MLEIRNLSKRFNGIPEVHARRNRRPSEVLGIMRRAQFFHEPIEPARFKQASYDA